MRSAVTAAATSEETPDLKAARRVFDVAGEAIAALGQSLNGDFSRAIDAILSIKGRVIVSGMGKSGHIEPGMVTREDAVLMLAYRGETVELGDLMTHAKRLRVPLIGIAGYPHSTLLQTADIALVLPNAREACPMGLAPTTSTTLMLVLGDALAVALM